MCQHGTDTRVILCKPRPISKAQVVAVDSCIAEIVQALNDAKIETTGSCCGHGKGAGSIILADGRRLFIGRNSAEEMLQQMVKDLFWMARRYAHGRHTYAPDMVRGAYKMLKRFFPEIKIEPDSTIEPPEEGELRTGFILRSDYLDDTNEPV